MGALIMCVHTKNVKVCTDTAQTLENAQIFPYDAAQNSADIPAIIVIRSGTFNGVLSAHDSKMVDNMLERNSSAKIFLIYKKVSTGKHALYQVDVDYDGDGYNMGFSGTTGPYAEGTTEINKYLQNQLAKLGVTPHVGTVVGALVKGATSPVAACNQNVRRVDVYEYRPTDITIEDTYYFFA